MERMVMVIILTILLVCIVESKKDITIGALFPMGGTWDGSGILPGVQMALQHVNADDNVLPNYTLKMEWRDAQCDAGVGMKSFFELLYEEPTKIMLLGAACSVVSQPVAATAQHWNLVQLSYASASDALSNRERYKYFFRVFPPDSAVNEPRIQILKEYGWNKVATLHQTEELFSRATDLLISDLEVNNIELVTSESVETGSVPTNQLANIKKKGARIIITNMYEDQARLLFCEAYKQGMYGEKYVYFVIGWYIHDWWADTSNIDCTSDQLKEVIEFSIGTEGLQLSPDNTSTISGLTPTEFVDTYHEFLNGSNPAAQIYASYGYDALWAAALSLHRVAEQLRLDGSNLALEDFDYDNTYGLREMLMSSLNATNFIGVSGPVSFNKNGDRFGITKIEQLRVVNGEFEQVTIGLYYPQGYLVWFDPNDKLLFRGGKIPWDSAKTVILTEQIPLSVLIIFTILASCGVILASAFLFFNISNRRRKLIKLSSPKMNNVIAIGCMICYISVSLFGVDSSLVNPDGFVIICRARIWALCLGFTLAFGGLFSKTWRVYAIFTNKTNRKLVIKDYHLFLTTFFILLADVIVLTTWMAMDPPQRIIKRFSATYDMDGDDIITIPEIEICQSVKYNPYIWLGTIYVFKGLLLLYGARLAWETRKVKIPELNDSKYIGMSIYNVTTLCVIGAPVVAVIGDQVLVTYCLEGAFILFCTTATLCLVFIPKVISLRSHPVDEGLKITTMVVPEGTWSGGNKISPIATRDLDSQRIKEMELMISQLKRALNDRDEEIDHLHSRLAHLNREKVTSKAYDPDESEIMKTSWTSDQTLHNQ